jgi:hypothetical protein
VKTIRKHVDVLTVRELNNMHDVLTELGFKHVAAELVEHPEHGRLLEHNYYRDSDQEEAFSYTQF